MIQKKAIRVVISFLLLICFSAVALPLDFFHNHAEEEVSCDSLTAAACSHKVHFSKKAGYCFACAFHLDKTFTINATHFNVFAQAEIFNFASYILSASNATLILTFLRGPPIFFSL